MNLQRLPEPLRERLAVALQPVPGLGFEPVAGPEHLALADSWIFSRLATVSRETNEALDSYRFHEAAFKVYHFFWHEFCDWYLEWVKPEITAPVEGARMFEASLHLLHPFMPFLTEELWHQLPRAGHEPSISLTPFSLASERVADPVSEKRFQTVQDMIVTARNAKVEMGLQNQKPSAQVASDDLRVLELFRLQQETALRLAGLKALNFTRGRLPTDIGGVRVTPTFDLRLFHEEPIHREAERSRLQKEREKLDRQLAQVKKQLENQEFLSRAPREVVRGVEHRHSELNVHYRKVLESLERLG
jgi:valyl-tRNA synthetase